MFSEDELRSVDDWRFNNRVATRADAVRKLAQMGIVASGQVDEMLLATRAAAECLAAMNKALTENAVDGGDPSGVARIVNGQFDALSKQVIAANGEALRLAEYLVMIQETEELTETFETARGAHAEAEELRQKLREKLK